VVLMDHADPNCSARRRKLFKIFFLLKIELYQQLDPNAVRSTAS